MATDDDGDVDRVDESGVVAACTAVAIGKVYRMEGKGERLDGKGVRRGYSDFRAHRMRDFIYRREEERNGGVCVEWSVRDTRLGAVLLLPTPLYDETAASSPAKFKKEKGEEGPAMFVRVERSSYRYYCLLLGLPSWFV
jgi:hypothetical protein